MLWKGRRQSSNVEDRRGMGAGGGMRFPGGLGGLGGGMGGGRMGRRGGGIGIFGILILLGVFPSWGYSRGWGYGPSGIVGTILVVVLVLLLLGQI